MSEGSVTEALNRLAEEHARYRKALVRIADAESGHWGWIAFDALHPGRSIDRRKGLVFSGEAREEAP